MDLAIISSEVFCHYDRLLYENSLWETDSSLASLFDDKFQVHPVWLAILAAVACYIATQNT